jgi:hypothetical protein
VNAGVVRTNNKIRDAIKGKRDAETIKKLQSPDEVAAAVNAAFPAALFSIEQWDVNVQSDAAKANFPGRVVGTSRSSASVSMPRCRSAHSARGSAPRSRPTACTWAPTSWPLHRHGQALLPQVPRELASGKDEQAATRAAIGLGAEGGPLLFLRVRIARRKDRPARIRTPTSSPTTWA